VVCRSQPYLSFPLFPIHLQTEIVLKGVVRAERLPDPTEFIQPILDRVKKEYISRTYGIASWEVRRRRRRKQKREAVVNSLLTTCCNIPHS